MHTDYLVKCGAMMPDFRYAQETKGRLKPLQCDNPAGLAAMVELVSEPLYILAQVRLQLQVRVVAEAAATLVRGVLTLALLKTAACDVGIALSMAQVTSPPSCTQPHALAASLRHIPARPRLQPQACLCQKNYRIHV